MTWTELGRNEYRRSSTVEILRQRLGWIDATERLLVNQIADEVRCQPILDIGVGGGRTAWMLRLLSSHYVAVDLSPDLVRACQEQYPGLDVRVGDAQDLSGFPDRAFQLVMFSFNGLDLLDHAGRLRALAEFHRVLRPGGLLLYSTLNKNGPNYRRRPWTVHGPVNVRHVARFAYALPSSLPRYWRSYANWWQRRKYDEDHGTWAIAVSFPFEFRAVGHFTLPSTERSVLESIGFVVEEVREFGGKPVDDDSSTGHYIYVLARRPRET